MNNRYTLHCGDNREVLKTMPDNSIDSIVCDPPYELGFMGNRWDSSGIAYDQTLWAECLRVLKPGGHLIAFGGTRTYHRMTVAIEDAGFSIRDSIIWMYGSGFPKSHNVASYIQSLIDNGFNRQIIRKGTGNLNGRFADASHNFISQSKNREITNEKAIKWNGWGTALKPAHEPAVLARKPLTGTVADNVLTWGTGALNIDGSRVEATADDVAMQRKRTGGTMGADIENNIYAGGWKRQPAGNPSGRWPANVILDEHAAEALDEQSDAGASRFFYTAKASTSEREAGLDAPDGQRANIHATVKPIALMRYLVRLVTPLNGTVLDPFMGSGSTGCASMLEGMRFVGIDLTPEYVEIAERRILHYLNQNPMGL